MRAEGCYGGRDLNGILDISLPRGGPDLLAANTDDADRHVEQLHPRPGTGEVPAGKVSDRGALPGPVTETTSSNPATP